MNPGQVFHTLIQERSFSNGGRESAHRRTAFGVLAAVQVTLIAAITVVLASVGAVTGTLAGGVLAGTVSWRWCFLAVALAGLAEAAAAGRLVPAGPPGAAVRLGGAGALPATGAVTLRSSGLIGTAGEGGGAPPVVAPP